MSEDDAFLNFNVRRSAPHASLLRTTLSSSASSSTYSSPFFLSPEWFEMDGCVVLFPNEKVPRSIVHFVGGFLAGSSVEIAYSTLLPYLAASGHMVVATPIPAISVNHSQVADQCFRSFAKLYKTRLTPLLGPSTISTVPVIGLSHSLGGKLSVILNSNRDYRKLGPKRLANVFMAFNNFGLKDAMDLSAKESKAIQSKQAALAVDLKKSKPAATSKSSTGGLFDKIDLSGLNDFSEAAKSFANNLDGLLGSTQDGVVKDILREAQKVVKDVNAVQFTPSPDDLWTLLVESYNVPYNYLFKFADDEIDQSLALKQYLTKRGCDLIQVVDLPGNHLTPNMLEIEGDVAGQLLQRRLAAVFDKLSGEIWEKEQNKYSTSRILPSTSGVGGNSIGGKDDISRGGERKGWDSDNI